MKRAFTVFIAVLFALYLIGCAPNGIPAPQSSGADSVPPAKPDEAPGASDSIESVLTEDMRSIYENRGKAVLPAAVIYTFQGNGVLVQSPLYEPQDVNAVLDAILEITLVAPSDIAVADSDTSYKFIDADGSTIGSLSFNGPYLVCGDSNYEVDNVKSLKKIDFTARSDSDTLCLDSPDPNFMEFLEKSSEQYPVSIKVERDGSDKVITDAAIIEEAVESLYSIGFGMYSYQGADEPETTLRVTFTMQDGSEYALTFYDDAYYIYAYPEPLGIWTYYTYNLEYFIEALDAVK